MAGKRYYSVDYPRGLTKSQFKRLPRAEKREVMLAWFGQNYEDPAQRTPYESAEGGYQYLYGGPFDAHEELGDEFYDVAPEKLIREVAEGLERESYEWTHTPEWDDYDDEDPPPPEDESDVLDRIMQAVAADIVPHYGGAYETEQRQTAKASLDQLLSEMDRLHTVGIGHNNPPEPIDEALTEKDRNDIEKAATGIRAALDAEQPDVPQVVERASVLRKTLAKVLRWAGKKLDVAVDGFMKKAGERAFDALWLLPLLQVTGVYGDVVRSLADAYHYTMAWLHTVALPF